MNNDQLDQLESLAEKATPGPWHVTECRTGFSDLSDVQPESEVSRGYPACSPHTDAAFIAACDPDTIRRLIAAARQAVPA